MNTMEDEIKKSVNTSLHLTGLPKDQRDFMATLISKNIMNIIDKKATA